MTSKEKANELAMKYDSNGKTDNAVRCAIIAVEEIIQVTREDPYNRKRTHMDKQYWQEVKQHLEEML